MGHVVRAAVSADAAGIAAVYAPYVSGTATSFEEQPPTATTIAARMQEPPRRPWWVAVEDDTIVGYAYAATHRARPAYRWSVEVSVYVAAEHHGLGLGRRLYAELLRDVRELGYVHACAVIALPNSASVRLHEAFGFAPTGVFRSAGYKLGNWHDVGWWHLQLAEPPDSPAEPRAREPGGLPLDGGHD